jgi:hypothetical protein
MKLYNALVVCGMTALALTAHAAVSESDAARLKGDLTPFGAEKAGNKDGDIPAWTGGYTTPIPGDKPGGRRGDPFKDEKPIFSITNKNMDQYADKLTDGSKALLKKYDDYRIDVYKTHRTASAPQWVYDNTLKNATRAELKGDILSGAFGGVPFPVPKTGAEVMWNHLTSWRGSDWKFSMTQYQITANGKAVMTSDIDADEQMPYYKKDGSLEEYSKSPELTLMRLVNVGPPIRAGEAVVGRMNLDSDKDQIWAYLTGQRRVRKLAAPCCDTPAQQTAGVMTIDEVEVFTGKLTRFDWKLVGKQEMYIPYNNNKMLSGAPDAEVIGSHFVNPDFVRWEKHRVWIVEANLKPGERHQAARSRYYCDEDTWMCMLADRWDSKGTLWRALWIHNFVAPDLPGLARGAFGVNDFSSGAAYIANMYTSKPAPYVLKPPFPDSMFTPDALAAESAR